MKTQIYELLKWQRQFYFAKLPNGNLPKWPRLGRIIKVANVGLLTLEINSNKNSDTFVFFSLNETWNVQGFTVKSDSDEDIL